MKNKLIELDEEKSAYNYDQIVEVFLEIGKRGDIIIIKNDGLRETHPFTVIIISGNGKFNDIRHDSFELNSAIKLSLSQYLKV